MKRATAFLIGLAVIWGGCGGNGNDLPRDVEPPSVQVTYPLDGSTVHGTVDIAAEATDNEGVRKVEFYVDGIRASTSSSEPYTHNWVTTTLQDSSSHTIYAKAHDAAGNIGTSGTITVIVDNRGGQSIWSDDFEAYASGSWPSPNWIDDGNTGGYVDDAVFHSGLQSLRLHGIIGVYWAELAYHTIGTSPPWTFECYIRNGNESIPPEGHPHRGAFVLRDQPTWTSGGRGLMIFSKDGHIYGAANEDLGTYQVDTWYKVGIRYEYPVAGQVRITYWIDDTQVGQVVLPPESVESSIAYLEVYAGAGTVWYDDARLIK